MRNVIRLLCAVPAVIGLILLCLLCVENQRTSSHYWVTRGHTLTVGDWVTVSPCDETAVAASAQLSDQPDTAAVSLKLMGIIPIRTATVTVTDTTVVVPCGKPFGIKLYTDGVLIVGFDQIRTEYGTADPGREAGLRIGDVILSAGGTAVRTMTALAKAVEQSDGKPLTLRIRRDTLVFSVTVSPARSAEEHKYQVGIWVRDSSAGIGTLTFYDPDSHVFAGLGHPVCDVDTGAALPIAAGEIVPARVFGVQRGVSGTPGGLLGSFDPGSWGTLSRNMAQGVYGTLTRLPVPKAAVPLAMKQDVHTGNAQVLTTVSGTTPVLYDVTVRRVAAGNTADGHDMVIEVTDPALLRQTGGIVQGMSGSPLMQDGKLIGAVTHVFVNDPTKGYGIFAETMLEATQSVANKSAQKEAS